METELVLKVDDMSTVEARLARTAELRERPPYLASPAEKLERLERFSSVLALDGFRRPLLSHQVSGVEWMLGMNRAVIADGCGVGKTAEAIAAARIIGLPTHVIAPATLLTNWEREARMLDWSVETHSWGSVPSPRRSPHTLIVDEAHYGKGSRETIRGRRFLDAAASATVLYMLTGTPAPNGRPKDIWPLVLATGHWLSLWPEYFKGRGRRRTSMGKLEELARLIGPIIMQRTKDEVLDLPPLTTEFGDVQPGQADMAVYHATFAELQAAYRARAAAGLVNENCALVALGHLRKAGALAKASAAVTLAKAAIAEGNNPILFTNFLDTANALTTALGAGRITGPDSQVKRQEAVDDFQAGRLDAVVATYGCGGVGLTLTAGSTVILVDRPWRPGDVEQAVSRPHRMGQTKPVRSIWLRLAGDEGKLDRRIDALLMDKGEDVDSILKHRAMPLPTELAAELFLEAA